MGKRALEVVSICIVGKLREYVNLQHMHGTLGIHCRFFLPHLTSGVRRRGGARQTRGDPGWASHSCGRVS